VSGAFSFILCSIVEEFSVGLSSGFAVRAVCGLGAGKRAKVDVLAVMCDPSLPALPVLVRASEFYASEAAAVSFSS
jgi:hypothetical protein